MAKVTVEVSNEVVEKFQKELTRFTSRKPTKKEVLTALKTWFESEWNQGDCYIEDTAGNMTDFGFIQEAMGE